MATWYNTGTVAVTNGNTTVTGTGTAWVTGKVQIGDAMHLPNGRAYEIAAVVSETQITLARGYEGSTGSGQAYQVQPTRGLIVPVINLIQGFNAALAGYVAGALAGRFGDGTSAAPGISFANDLGAGIFRTSVGKVCISTGGVVRAFFSDTELELAVPLSGAIGSTYYRKSNIVGTVSQTAGVPTGKIIETATNANGTYIKYADGTLVCYRKDLSLSRGGGSADRVESAWTYPAAFIASPMVSHQPNHETALNYATTIADMTNFGVATAAPRPGVTLTQALFRLHRTASGASIPTDASIQTNAFAIGRWF